MNKRISKRVDLPFLQVPKLAKSEEPISDDGEGWDSDPMLLGVANGIVDLATGELIPRKAACCGHCGHTPEEARYLAAAPEPLASIATVLIDSGMRPEECFRLKWESISWINGRHGSMLVTHGKTAAARRMLPMSPRVRAILETHWKAANQPLEGWVWPAPTASGHVEPSSIRKHHDETFVVVAKEATKNNLKPIRPFVLYTLRHTFLTRLGASGCDVWTLARIAGHSTIGISARYVHPSEDAVLAAMGKLTGAKPTSESNQRPMLPS